jgi:hypothetical protein
MHYGQSGQYTYFKFEKKFLGGSQTSQYPNALALLSSVAFICACTAGRMNALTQFNY